MLDGLISGGLSLLGGLGANSAARVASQDQMNFQERMSGTAVQRSAKDYENAGFNKLLAVANPASTPTGSMAPVSDPITPALSSAVEVSKAKQEIESQKKQNELIDEQKSLTSAQTTAAQAQASKTQKEAELIGNQLPESRLKGKIWQKVESAYGTSAKADQERETQLKKHGLQFPEQYKMR